MTIATVGSPVISSTLSTTVSPTAIGDVLVVSGGCSASLGGNFFTGISGGGVTTWNTAIGQVLSPNGDSEIFWGVVTATGSSTLIVTTSNGAGGLTLCIQQFNGPSSWSADGTNVDTGTSASGNYPSLTPSTSGELYVGCLYIPSNTFNSDPTGSTSGFTYVDFSTAGGGIFQNMGLFTYKVSTSGAASPNWTLPSGNAFQYGSCSLLLSSPLGGTQIVMIL